MITGVLGLAVRKDGKMLLTKRYAPGKKLWHGKWQFPGGGMEFGETPLQTLSREMEEELRVSVRIIFPYPIIKTKVWYGDHLDSIADTHLTLICYLVEINDETTIDVTQDEETSHFGWYSPEEALRLDSLPLTQEFVKEALVILKKNNLLV